jgi:glycosyltransferase involved in cell wall biosynthesis
LRVLIVSQHFYPELFRINAVAVSLARMGFIVDVLTGMPNYPKGVCFSGYEGSWLKKIDYEGIGVYRVPIFLRGRARNIELILNYCSFLLTATLFGGFWLSKKYDLVFCYATSPLLQAIPAIYLARKNQAPLVLNVQDLWPESVSATNRIKSPVIINLLLKVVSWIYSRADLILIQSESFYQSILQACPNALIQYWPNSVEPSLYQNKIFDQMPDELSEIYEDDSFKVTFAGNIGSAQAIETIIEAADILKNIPKIKIILVGDGSKRKWGVTESLKRGLKNIYFPGSYPENNIPLIYKKSSCLLVSLLDKDIFNSTIPNAIELFFNKRKSIFCKIDRTIGYCNKTNKY